MNRLFTKDGLKFNLVLLLLVFGSPIYDSVYQMFFFRALHGYEPNVFGYPKSLLEISFNFSFVLLSMVILIGLFRVSKVSWYLASGTALFCLLMLLMLEISLLSTYIGYFNWKYMAYILVLGWFLYFLHSAKVKVIFGVTKTYWLVHSVYITLLFILWFFCK